MIRRIPLFGSLAVGVAAMGMVAALAFGPPTSPQSPQSTSPPPTIGTPGEPTPVTPTTDKSVIPPSAPTGKLSPDTPSVASSDIQPELITEVNWLDKAIFDPLLLIVPIERLSPEADRPMSAARVAAGALVGRVSVQVAFFDQKNPCQFCESDPSGSIKDPPILWMHAVKTHVTVMDAQIQDQRKREKQKLATPAELTKEWTSSAYLKELRKDDGKRIMKKEDLPEAELAKLSLESQKRWARGIYDHESLVAWVNYVVAQDLKVNLAPGRANFRVLREENCLLVLSTRMPQWILFVHNKGKEIKPTEDMDEPAKRGARYADSRGWVMDADTDGGKRLFTFLTEDRERGIAGTSPPEDRPAIVGFQMVDNTLDPLRGAKKRWGPYQIDPKKTLPDEVDRILGEELKLRRTTAPIAVVTTQTASTGEPPPKK